MAITFDVANNRITITGYTEAIPCNFTDLYNADKAGTLSLHARTGIVGTDGAAVAVDKAERPTDFIVMGGASNDLYITIANWIGTTATIQITGTDRDGVAQTEDIVVNANGAFYTTKWFKTITHTQVTVFTATSFDYDLTQGQWGVVWKTGSTPFRFDCQILVGDGTITTWFQDKSKQVVFSDGITTYTNGLIHVLTNATFILGQLISEANKQVRYGCSINSEATAHVYMIRYAGGHINLYASVFSALNIYHYFRVHFNDRVWGCTFDHRCGFLYSNANYYQTSFFGNNASFYKPSSDCVFENIIVDGAQFAFQLERSEVTARNVKIVNSGYTAIASYAESDETYLIDMDVDEWKLGFISAPNAEFHRQWSVNLKIVDEGGNNIENAKVYLTTRQGGQALNAPDAGEDYASSNSDGVVAEQIVTQGYQNNVAGNIQIGDSYLLPAPTGYSPHQLEIRKPGYQTYKKKFTLNTTTEWIIRLKHSNVCVDQEVMLS